ncbi:UNVERIFIED_CONTAM: hypothetical protein Slati_4175100 [Sesamum latifolium]|uniref:DUF4283 domain-containing protein n=1 Tax=Sesamum latifolium TaxID=2727402 RepID=A0AAW2TB08_9LAMI
MEALTDLMKRWIVQFGDENPPPSTPLPRVLTPASVVDLNVALQETLMLSDEHGQPRVLLPLAVVAPPPPMATRISDYEHAIRAADQTKPTTPLLYQSSPASKPPTEIFIDNVLLTSASSSVHSIDKIASAFLNSSRKILSYIPPSMQNGEVIVRPSLNMIRDGSRRWNTTAIGYFLGKRPYFHHLNDFVRSIWPAVCEVTATVNGFFFFQFKTTAAMEEVIEGGPWLFQGQPIVLQNGSPTWCYVN